MKCIDWKQLYGLALLPVALIWGLGLAVQESAMRFFTPWLFNALASTLGAICLLPAVWFRRKEVNNERRLLTGGIICGILMTAASLFQQWGLVYESAGKAGFLTSLYVVAVPLLGLCFERRTSKWLWLSVVLAIAGTFLLCRPQGVFSLNKGDWLLLTCALCFGLHFIMVDKFSDLESCRFCCLQLAVTALLSGVITMINGEDLTCAMLGNGWKQLLYFGVISIGVGYTVQIYTQKYVHPAAEAVIFSMESVFALLGDRLIFGRLLNCTELTGGAIILTAMLTAQFFALKEKEKNLENNPSTR